MANERADRRSHPIVRHYTLICLLSLAVLSLVLLETEHGLWSLLPGLVGGVAVLSSWSVGPPLLLICLMCAVVSRPNLFMPSSLADLTLTVALLTYVVSHYRLQSLVRAIFPEQDSWRDPVSSSPSPVLDCRSPEMVPARELPTLLLLVLLWSGLGCLVWLLLLLQVPPLGLPLAIWRIVLVIWIFALALTLMGRWLLFRSQRGASAEESLLYLQDQLWRATCREQSRLNRWLTRARKVK